MKHLSRREFAALVATGVVAGHVAPPFARERQAPAQTVTVDDIIERIKRNVGVEWRSDTVDTIKAGNPATPVKGIVTTSLASMAVLRQAVAAGANLVITSEPTFFSRADARTPPSGRGRGAGPAAGATQAASPPSPPPPPDRVYAAKNEFINSNGLVIFRLSDHWRARTPDAFVQGFAAALGWASHQAASEPLRFDVPALSLETLVNTVKKTLNARGGIRVVGDPQTRVQRVAFLPGNTPIQAALRTLPHVDAIVGGEVREWESVEYARDVVYSGQRKGLVLVGRILSEDPGMHFCSTWLKTFVPEVPVRHVSAGDPYWRPTS